MSKRVNLRIRYNRRSGLGSLLALALLVAVFLGYLTWNQREVAASGLQAPLTASTSLRGYYLTQSMHNGLEAAGTDGNGAGVCAEGYHFASLWEILDPSNLKYDPVRGQTQDDSGQGPPSLIGGWVRTGNEASTSVTAGEGNCEAWTSDSGGERGTGAYLPSDWTAGQDIHVWGVGTAGCSSNFPIWCVADNVSAPVYLPIVVKNY